MAAAARSASSAAFSGIAQGNGRPPRWTLVIQPSPSRIMAAMAPALADEDAVIAPEAVVPRDVALEIVDPRHGLLGGQVFRPFDELQTLAL